MAIGYVRVSTKGQEEKYGIDAQKDAILDYAKKHGLKVTEFIVDVITGVKEERPGLERLLHDVQTDAVIVFKSDRLARDMKLYFYYLFLFEKKGIKLLSVNEEFADDALANVYRAIIMFVAEQERANIRLRTMRGREKKKAEGGFLGGRAPLGYFANDGKLYAEMNERKLVRKVFEYYAAGYGCQMISTIMNGEGWKTKNGQLYPMAVNRILNHRKFYEGYIRNSDFEWVKGKHPALIEENEFLREEE